MTDVLKAFGWGVGIGSAVCLLLMVGVATLVVIVLGAAIVDVSGVSIVAVQCAVWGLWLLWLGIVFPRNRQRDEDMPTAFPYRRAFMREILLGVAVAFGQLLRPVVHGALTGEPLAHDWNLAYGMGLPLALAGASTIYLGVSALGVARTLFVYEYVTSNQKVMTTGIFRLLRHPLFLGGAMVSLGLAICTGSQLAIELGIVNACVVPIYVRLEDNRCCAALGQAYVDYRAVVGAVIPRRRAAMSRSALAHHASGRTDPTAPRNLVTTR